MDSEISECSCRICLDNSSSYDLFTSRKDISVLYSDILSDVLSLKVDQDDGFPQKLCKKCAVKLVSAYKLKCLAHESFSKLTQFSMCIKNEKEEVKCESEIVFNNITSSSLVEVKSENFEDRLIPVEYDEPFEEDMNSDDEDDKPLNEYVTMKTPVNLVEELDSEVLSKEENKRNAGPVEKRRKRYKVKKVKIKVLKVKEKSRTMCHLCGKIVRDIERHAQIHTDNYTKFPCPDCPKVFKSDGSRRKHRNVHHLGKLYYCEICKSEYKHRWQHIRLKHSTAPRPFTCILCNKKFYTSGQLGRHLQFHTKERPHKCEICGKGFISSTEKNCHRRKVHENERTVMCQYCPKRFFSNHELKKHIRTHTGEKNFKCDECDKAFTRSNGLKEHKKLHRGLKDVKCELCSKEFYTKGNLSIHMITHTKEKKFPCKYCEVKFGRKHHRDRHEKKTHESKIAK